MNTDPAYGPFLATTLGASWCLLRTRRLQGESHCNFVRLAEKTCRRPVILWARCALLSGRSEKRGPESGSFLGHV